ncbi:MAG: LCP family protein [Anaerolineales bacterium]|nr:LCP family protein [Anaerolineales bacterium]
MTKPKTRSKARTVLPIWLSAMLASTFVVSGITVVLLAFLTLQEAFAHPLNPLEGNAVAQAAEDVAEVSLPPLDQESDIEPPTLEPGLPTPTPIPTTIPIPDSDRITVLLVGVDRRPGDPFISRTDTMMLFTVDPDTNTAAILSIPRDLYVVIPGRGRDRINTAYVYGAAGNNPAGGAALAMQTVEYNLGIHVNYYLAVDFSAVENGVDALGGIDVNVPVTINDPLYPDHNYGYDPLYIEAGPNHFDGELALKYARTRHQDSDFHRASRQQQVVLAVRDKILALGFGEMLTRAPLLWAQFSDGVRTDMSLEQMTNLAILANEVPAENLHTAVLGPGYVSNYTTEQGAQVLILDNYAAADLIQELFYGTGQ